MPKYSVKYKKIVVDFYKVNGMVLTRKKFGHATSVIYGWKRKSETVGLMRKKNKTYSKQEKLDILNYYWKNGVVETELKFDITRSSVWNWERTFREYGVEALDIDNRGRKSQVFSKKKDLNKDKDLLEENQDLRMELMYLKKLDALIREQEEIERKKKLK